MAITITSIEKKGPVIICMTNDNRSYRLDFQNAKIYGLTGKLLQSTDAILKKIPDALQSNPLYIGLNMFAYSNYLSADWCAVVESLLSYPELLSQENTSTGMVRYLITNCGGKLPKGYVAWCRENDKQFSTRTLKNFWTDQKLAQWPQQLRDTVRKFSEGVEYDLAENTNYDRELCASIIRIVNNSLKLYQISNLRSCIKDIVHILYVKPQLRSYLDDTKNATVAYKILLEAMNKERNDAILANEAKLASLDGVVIDDVVIKIPSTMEDFNNEGEQQHNCVGYYYHEAMAHGEALIYFLRKVENPDKSYVTCRFVPERKVTVEHRTANNNWFENDSLMKKIDRMIIPLLEG